MNYQRLIYGVKYLEDDRILFYYNILKETTLQVSFNSDYPTNFEELNNAKISAQKSSNQIFNCK
jgi:hypothetical protein